MSNSELNDSISKEQAQKLLQFSKRLLKGDYTFRLNSAVDDSQFSKICSNLNGYADRMQLTSFSNSEEVTSQLTEFIDVISSYANRDFSKKLSISKDSNFIDALATGINILGEELQSTTVSKRELEAQHEKLKIAKEEAENASRLKSIFMGNLSHEVRTPLQAIQGFAEILDSNKLSPEKRSEYLRIIKNRSTDLQNIIDSLLDLASLETGELKAFTQPCYLKEIIERSFKSIKQDYSLNNTNIDIKLKLNIESNAQAIIDTTHLHQVISNLMNNAIKFTEKGSIIMQVQNDEKQYLILIEDSGIGISEDDLKNIFEPFRQAHEGLSRSKGGIGLGLSICKRMVEMWSGKIYATSKIGEGSTFYFSIPKIQLP